MTSDLNWENHNRWFHNYIETDQSSIVLLSGEKLILANLGSWTEVKFAISSGYLNLFLFPLLRLFFWTEM